MTKRKLPQHLIFMPEIEKYLPLKSRGKVRDAYQLSKGKYLSVVSDRVSIFDFVLGFLVPGKGAILNAINLFMALVVLKAFKHDIVAYGAGIDKYLPEPLRGNPELQKRATVIRRIKVLPYEGIGRNHLTGSALKPYQETGKVCGVKLPAGLKDGDKLPEPIFTPTTKAKVGHDEHVDAGKVKKEHPGFVDMVMKAAKAGYDYLLNRGIILVDTKFEGNSDCLGDERLTPDSSRFVDAKAYEAHRQAGKAGFPASLDKQFVREEGKKRGINGNLDPENEKNIETVFGMIFDPMVVKQTVQIYRYIFWRITGMRIETFQKEFMGIAVDDRVHIEVLVGSESDIPQVEASVGLLWAANKDKHITYSCRVMSCHRNPEDVKELAAHITDLSKEGKLVRVVAEAGMAAALPGVLKSWLVYFDAPEVPVIGVGLKGKEVIYDLAARTSIACLPGTPVELDPNGKGDSYFGREGSLEACYSAVHDEFPLLTITPKKTYVFAEGK